MGVPPLESESESRSVMSDSLHKREQDGGGVGGRGVHLSPQIHQESTFRHRSACKTPAESGQEYLITREEYIEPCKNSVGLRN